MTPFSYETRKEIGVRDGWCCTDCGRRFQDGFMVQASHYDHTRDENYDCPENGCIKCLACHLHTHINIMLEDENDWSFNSVRLLAGNAYNNGLRTYKETTEDTLIEDRQEVVSILENYGLNPDNFL